MSLLVCCDPGKTTGLAVFTYGQYGENTSLILTHECQNMMELAALLDVTPRILSRIVCEKVRQARQGFDDSGVKVMGALEFYCALRDVKLDYQIPAMMQGPVHWAADELKLFSSPHIRDAICHGIAFFHKTMNVPYRKEWLSCYSAMHHPALFTQQIDRLSSFVVASTSTASSGG